MSAEAAVAKRRAQMEFDALAIITAQDRPETKVKLIMAIIEKEEIQAFAAGKETAYKEMFGILRKMKEETEKKKDPGEAGAE